MRTNRTALAGALAIILAIAPGTVAAEAADGEEPSAPSYWTSTETSGPMFSVTGGESGAFPWGTRTTRGFTVTSEATDPRASGDITVVYVVDWSDKYDVGRGIGLARLVNEGGSFEGPIHVAYYPDGSEFRMVRMEGQAGYEGLSLVMTTHLDNTGEGRPQGLIWEGEPPSLPDANALPE